MTNASVKPALTRIEGKLDEIDKAMKELNNKEKTENNETTSEIVGKPNCGCKNDEIEQAGQKNESPGESPQNEDK